MPSALQSYLSSLGALSKAKRDILRRLWGSDDSPFPKPWTQSSELLRITGQKYFDRRIRELRDEFGCDIETEHYQGEHSYRLRSARLSPPKPREYLTGQEKKALFTRHDYVCQICGKRMPPGVRGLQADHKIPLIRGGSHAAGNWQPICTECNVGKRGACAGCEDDCRLCPWAFPEKVGRVTLLRLPPDVLEALSKRSGGDQCNLEREVTALLKKVLGIGTGHGETS